MSSSPTQDASQDEPYPQLNDLGVLTTRLPSDIRALISDYLTGIRDCFDDKGEMTVCPMENYVVEGDDGLALPFLTTDSAPDEETIETLSEQAMLLLMSAILQPSDQSITWAWDGTPDDHTRIKEEVLTGLEADTGSAQIRQAVERRFKVCNVDEAGVGAAVSLLERIQDRKAALRERGLQG